MFVNNLFCFNLRWVNKESYCGYKFFATDRFFLIFNIIISHINRNENELGVIKCYLEGQESDIMYRVRDCRPREMVRYRDKVEFVLITKKTNQAMFARDISVLEKNNTKLLNGYICALKDSYGFIESEDHATELFFHFSEYEGDTKHLELGDCVMYAETRKGEKCSAEKVCRVLSHVNRDDVLPGIFDGVVTRPLRTMDPDVRRQTTLDPLSVWCFNIYPFILD